MMPTMIARLGLLAAMFAVLSQGVLPHRLANARLPGLMIGSTGALILAAICGDPGGERDGSRSPGAPGHDHACVLCSMCPAGCSAADAGMPPAGGHPVLAPTLAMVSRSMSGHLGFTPDPGRTGQPRGPPLGA